MSRLWRALEGMGGPDGFEAAGVAAFWRERIGEEFDMIRGTLLRQLLEPATSVPCPRGCGCQHEVFQGLTGKLEGLCRCEDYDCDDIPVTETDLIVYELHWPKLGRALASAFDFDAKEGPRIALGTSQIGTFGIAAMPVFLTIQLDDMGFYRQVMELAAKLRGPYIVLAPTSRMVDARAHELLANNRAGFFDLESRVTLLPSGNLAARQTAGQLFQPHLPEPERSVSAAEAKRVIEMSRLLNTDVKARKAPLGVVFEMLVRQDFSQERVAQECGCAPSLISARVAEIEKRMGLPLAQLKALATQLGDTELGKDSRAKSVYRKDPADYPRDEETDE